MWVSSFFRQISSIICAFTATVFLFLLAPIELPIVCQINLLALVAYDRAANGYNYSLLTDIPSE